MFNSYISEIMPIPLENIEVSPNNPYMYRITAFASLVNENRSLIDKILKKNKHVSNYDGWWNKPQDCFFKQALIEFKREKNAQNN